ncbi:MAG TPA: LPXTG cell wall anchor domain-containing protein [Candidatus Chromulinivoraceae bacterium]|nr:LPXTG cell wall anchor domain-containing protein [Candidatus Chromulinivoraceae bacterium]
MNKFIAAIKRSPKRNALLAVVFAAVMVPAALFAWGPDRPTFTMAHPAPYVTFNSITDNPQRGDERNFVGIKADTAPNSAYSQNTTLQPGQNYDVLVYYHNNAASNLNDAAHNYVGIAHGAFMRVQMPATVDAGQQARVTAFVGATNANPQQVWSEAYGNASGNYALTYVPGSATIYNWGATNGSKMPDSLYTTGTPLGYDKLDGNLPGCNNYSGYVIFKIHVDQPNFEIQKTVSKAGTNQYAAQVSAQPGDEVEYKIQYKDTGTTQQNNVLIKDQLPAGVTYENGTTQIATSATNGQWTATNDGVTNGGINIGSYAPGGNAYLKFKAKIASNDQLAQCGLNTLVNTATADTANGSKSATATVTVTKTCETPNTVQVCDQTTGKTITVDVKDQSKYKPVGDVACQPTTPTTPTELPHTGASDSIIALIGAGSLVAAIGYYITSRRALN